MSKIQSRLTIKPNLIASLLTSFNQSTQFIKSFVRYTWFKGSVIYKVLPIFEHAHPIIIEVPFSFPKFVSACKKSARFINSFLKYSRFQSPTTKEAMPIFDHHHPKIIKVNFDFPKFLSTHQKSVYSFLK